MPENALVSAPVFAAPDPNKRFCVHTDDSTFELGAVLSRVGADGSDHPIAYISRKLLPEYCHGLWAAGEPWPGELWVVMCS